MNRKIIQRTLIAGIVAFLIGTFVMYVGISRYTNRQLLQSLELESAILNTVVEADGEEGLEAYIYNIPVKGKKDKAAPVRHVVWLNADGSVILDSAPSEENYAQREEFIDALEKGTADENYGVDSFTGMVVSHASVLEDGTVLIMEAAAPTFSQIFSKTGGTFAIAIILFIVICTVGANLTCRRIIKDLNELDPDNRRHVDYFYDLRPMTERMGLTPPAVVLAAENAKAAPKEDSSKNNEE